MSKTFQQLIAETTEVGKRFPNKWDLKTHYIDLVEEVGELGNAILVESGNKSENRQRAELKDSFADVLFELILMADEAKIDLEEVITQMLQEVRVRQDNKEYENR